MADPGTVELIGITKRCGAAAGYQGAAMRVVVRQGEVSEAVALVPDSEFHAAPTAVGDPATLSWSDEHAHLLA